MGSGSEGFAYKYLHEEFGSNYRMTEMQAGIGIIQLKKLSQWTKDREKNAKIIINRVKNIKCVRSPLPNSNIQNAWYKLYIYIRSEFLKKDWNRDKILNEINNMGYPAGSGSCGELYLEKAFRDNGFKNFIPLKNARELEQSSIMLLIHPTIKDTEIKNYASAIESVLLKASN